MKTFAMFAMAFCCTGCVIHFDGHDWDSRYKEDFRYTKPLSPGGRLSVEGNNGSIEIAGWDKDEVEISGTKWAISEDGLRDVKIVIDASAGSVSVRSVTPVYFGRSGVQYVIRAPRRVVLDRIHTSNGQVKANDIEGAVRVHTSNGTVILTRVKGDVGVETTNGAVELREVRGDASVHTSNGRVTAEMMRGSLDARTTNGKVSADLTETGDKPVKISTSNGTIDLRIGAQPRSAVRVNTSNGAVTLRLPENANVRVDAHTSNSRVESDFASVRHGDSGRHRDSERSASGQIGVGGPEVEVSTSHGRIRLLKL